MTNTQPTYYVRFVFILIISLSLSACGSKKKLPVENLDPALDPNYSSTLDYFASNIGDTVYFNTNQSQIRNFDIPILTAQASWLSSNPEYHIVIEGHADERGTREYNLALSSKRAHYVRKFLIENGVQKNRILTIPYGKEKPQKACYAENCWEKNRRSVIVISQISQ